MIKSTLINKIKYSKLLYNVYFSTGSLLVKILKCVLKTDDKLILFTSYSGKRYDDTPKDIFEAMLNDYRFDNYKFVWGFMDPKSILLERCEVVNINSIYYLIKALRARVWITNVNMTRGLGFQGINTFSFNSWHGTAIKYIGEDIKSNEETFVLKNKSKLADVMIAQGKYDVDIYSRAFGLSKDNVIITGFPRNDSLITNNTPDYVAKIKDKLNIDKGKKIILYAPTYRDYEKDEGRNCVLKPPIDFEKWKEQLFDEYILLIRAHQEVVKVLDIEENEFIRNVSNYPVLNDILLITDILISDYSGILFDYSILNRPIYCYTYDYDRYNGERGMYIDIRKDLKSFNQESDLIKSIKADDYNSMVEQTTRFRDKYVQQYGNASQKCLDLLYSEINSNK